MVASTTSEPTWLTIALRKRATRAASINAYLQSHHIAYTYEDDPAFYHTEFPFPKFVPRDVTGGFAPEGLKLTDRQTALTCVDATALAEEVAKGTYTATEVTEAFVLRSIIAQVYTNCVTEVLFKDALAQAKVLDEVYKTTGATVGPLHGVPVSVKDQCNVRGYDSSLGYIAWCEDPKTEDGVIVSLLKKAGAVIICKTNVPQSLMDGETFNHIFGRTLNPKNRDVNPSGSSGGEGALMRMRGALLGIGSDIGGSVRGPANYNGVFALKPSTTRLPYLGAVSSCEGQLSVPSVLGPFATTARDLELVMDAIVGGEPWMEDPNCVPMAWDKSKSAGAIGAGKEVFGYFVEDPLFPVVPAVQRAVLETRDALIASGHEVVPFTLPPQFFTEMLNCLNALYAVDGGRDMRECVEEGKGYGKGYGRWGSKEAWKKEPYVPTVEMVVKGAKEVSVWENWQLNLARDRLAKEFLEHWKSTKSSTGSPISGLICPVGIVPPLPHRVYEGLWDDLVYMGFCNLLQLSSASVPCTSVLATDAYPASHVPPNDFSRDVRDKYVSSLETIVGVPVGVQVVGKKLDEEALVRMVGVVDGALRKSRKVSV